MSSQPASDEPRALVSEWIDAFNERDLERMLACMSAEVRFHPLRLTGLDRSYRGHDGVRGWLRQLEELGHRHRIHISEIGGGSDGEVLGVGSVLRLRDADPARSGCCTASRRPDRRRPPLPHGPGRVPRLRGDRARMNTRHQRPLPGQGTGIAW